MFTLPVVYDKYQAQIDQYLGLVRTHINAVVAKLFAITCVKHYSKEKSVLEKQLQNEGLVFNKETVKHLEDAIKSIKELEEERKHTIELLEEETIKNCNLRVRIKGFPEIVIKEFEELVAAAHRFHFNKLSEVELSVSNAVSAVESTYSRQEISEEENVALWAELLNKVTTKDEDFDNEREDLLRKIKEAEEQLEVAKRCYKKLKDENDLLNTQFEHLSNMLTEKLDYVAKRLVETKNVEEELDRLQEIFDTSQNTYANEMSVLEVTLKREAERRAMLQKQLNDITEQYQKLMAEHEALLNSSKEKIDAAKKQLNELTAQNKKLNKQITKDEKLVNFLTALLCKKQAEYEKRDATLEAEIQNLEALYHATLKRIEEMEEELKVNLPLSQKMAIEYADVSTGYTHQQDLYSELQEEERMLKKSIERSLKEIGRLKRQKFQAKNEIKKHREIAFKMLKQFTVSLKFIERDNYEMDIRLYILDAENARLRAGIAYLKEDISTIDKEIKIYQSERQNIQKDRRNLYDLFNKKWIKDEHLHKMFLEYQKDFLKILGEYIRLNKRRNYKLDYIHGGLQLKYDKLENLLQSKSNKET
ncbi:hypothetical protein JD844_020447 [Phrynosoma platyrhinos]|uniref:Reticulon domain-containing protein n=1 Tax=Phrynosoma platyrhinos TaxID=52577 RepID=A0ABQ7SSG5_PHRPL|nr:hypothetical protein JD844_020447 [Phrynosoma platyrhinos]